MMNNAKAWLISLPLLAAISACSMTVPVSGQLMDGSETFTGTADTGMTTSAPFTMTSNQGAACSGTFTLATLTTGQGEFVCDDGRSGAFDFKSSGGKIIATGTIANAPLTLTFG